MVSEIIMVKWCSAVLQSMPENIANMASVGSGAPQQTAARD
jgi:hypothetical protein